LARHTRRRRSVGNHLQTHQEVGESLFRGDRNVRSIAMSRPEAERMRLVHPPPPPPPSYATSGVISRIVQHYHTWSWRHSPCDGPYSPTFTNGWALLQYTQPETVDSHAIRPPPICLDGHGGLHRLVKKERDNQLRSYQGGRVFRKNPRRVRGLEMHSRSSSEGLIEPP